MNSVKLRAFQMQFRVLNKALQSSIFSAGIRLSMSTMAPVRVRFAPSPTGSLHVGGARTALFNWMLAKKSKGVFIVRVEDTDEARSTRASEKAILDDLKWMNMQWDEGPEVEGPHGPYRQSERKHIYKKAAEKLIADGNAYRCFCSNEELDAKRAAAEAAGIDPKYDGTWRDADPVLVQERLNRGDPYTVRFKIPPGKVVYIDDRVRGRVTWDADASLGDFIIMRSNGMPVYNFCVSVDDADMRITHVVRAEEHLSNTPRQLLILEALNFKPPIYAHCSLILGSDRSKLSKRHGATSVKQFSEQGIVPDAMMNYLANLGWNDGTDKEIYTPEELYNAFDVSRIIKSAAVFDMDKLKWVNAQHLRNYPIEKIELIVLKELCSKSYKVQNNTVANTDSNATTTVIMMESILPPSAAAAVNCSIDGSDKEDIPLRSFLRIATKIAQRDMDLTTDTYRLVDLCLRYDLHYTLCTDNHAIELLQPPASSSLLALIATLIQDYNTGKLPHGFETDFSALWKDYMKQLGKQLGLKGKALYHPVRLCLTGRMSGPDVGDQLQLIALSEGGGENNTSILNPAYVQSRYYRESNSTVITSNTVMNLKERIDYLSKFSLTDALLQHENLRSQPYAAITPI